MRCPLRTAVLCVLTVAALQPANAMDIETTTHVYKTVNDTSLTLEYDAPHGEGPFPLMFYIHGGGWTRGDAAQFVQQSRHLAGLGIAGVRINYRKADVGAKLADSLNDIEDAMTWVRDHADEYQFDLERLGFAGGSAGAHLSAIAAQTVPEAKVHVGFNGPYDLVEFREQMLTFQLPMAEYFDPLTEENLRSASPQHIIREDPPVTLLLSGTHDRTVPFMQSLKYANAINKKGGDARVMLYAGYDHGFFNPGNEKYAETLAEMELFLTRVFELDRP